MATLSNVAALKKKADPVDYWRNRVSEYVRVTREKRGTREKVAAETGLSAATLKAVETQITDPSIGTLIRILEAIDGDVSTVFRSNIPKALHGKHQYIHEMLQEAFSDDPDFAALLATALENPAKRAMLKLSLAIMAAEDKQARR